MYLIYKQHWIEHIHRMEDQKAVKLTVNNKTIRKDLEVGPYTDGCS